MPSTKGDDLYNGDIYLSSSFEHAIFLFLKWHWSVALTTLYDGYDDYIYSIGMVREQRNRGYTLVNGCHVHLHCTQHYSKYDSI